LQLQLLANLYLVTTENGLVLTRENVFTNEGKGGTEIKMP